MAPPRRPLRDNPRLILAGMIVLLAALVGIVALANSRPASLPTSSRNLFCTACGPRTSRFCSASRSCSRAT